MYPLLQETGSKDDRAIAMARDQFLSGNNEISTDVRPLVALSWRRSRDFGIDPVKAGLPVTVEGDALFSLQQQHAELIAAAAPVIAESHERLIDHHAYMVLSDPTGIVLWMEGDATALDEAQEFSRPGSNWNELIRGTNGIGTTLARGKPVQIASAEHYCNAWDGFTCSGGVIRDPYDGQILGALNVSGRSGEHDSFMHSLAIAGTGVVETQLTFLELEKRSRLLDHANKQAERWRDRGLIILDRKGRAIRANEYAKKYLKRIGHDMQSLRSSGLYSPSGLQYHCLPSWARQEWLEPISDRGEHLGAVLVLPPEKSESVILTPKFSRPFAGIIGHAPPIVAAKERAERVAKLQVPVLLLGPTGSGKEVFARALHDGGSNPAAPFIAMNCGAVTRDMLGNELFGHAEGAFTGSRRGGMIGKFEAANGGTLFLDEIGELPLELQPMLLRVLEEGEVCRLGETKARKVRVRVIAATNRDLRADIAAGKFRADLFYRLAVTQIELPALKDRLEDLPMLLRHFIDRAARIHGVSEKSPTARLLKTLMDYSWPGNIRELRNVTESMVLLAEHDLLTEDDLPAEILARVKNEARALPSFLETRESYGKLADRERQVIVEAIHADQGNLTRAAACLGIAKSTLYEKMKRYGIER